MSGDGRRTIVSRTGESRRGLGHGRPGTIVPGRSAEHVPFSCRRVQSLHPTNPPACFSQSAMPTRFALAAASVLLAAPAAVAQKVDYARDVLPILSDNCFACHGPDEKARKAKL